MSDTEQPTPVFVPRSLVALERGSAALIARFSRPVRALGSRTLGFVDRLIGMRLLALTDGGSRGRPSAGGVSTSFLFPVPWYELEQDEIQVTRAPRNNTSAPSVRRAPVAPARTLTAAAAAPSPAAPIERSVPTAPPTEYLAGPLPVRADNLVIENVASSPATVAAPVHGAEESVAAAKSATVTSAPIPPSTGRAPEVSVPAPTRSSAASAAAVSDFVPASDAVSPVHDEVTVAATAAVTPSDLSSTRGSEVAAIESLLAESPRAASTVDAAPARASEIVAAIGRNLERATPAGLPASLVPVTEIAARPAVTQSSPLARAISRAEWVDNLIDHWAAPTKTAVSQPVNDQSSPDERPAIPVSYVTAAPEAEPAAPFVAAAPQPTELAPDAQPRALGALPSAVVAVEKAPTEVAARQPTLSSTVEKAAGVEAEKVSPVLPAVVAAEQPSTALPGYREVPLVERVFVAPASSEKAAATVARGPIAEVAARDEAPTAIRGETRVEGRPVAAQASVPQMGATPPSVESTERATQSLPVDSNRQSTIVSPPVVNVPAGEAPTIRARETASPTTAREEQKIAPVATAAKAPAGVAPKVAADTIAAPAARAASAVAASVPRAPSTPAERFSSTLASLSFQSLPDPTFIAALSSGAVFAESTSGAPSSAMVSNVFRFLDRLASGNSAVSASLSAIAASVGFEFVKLAETARPAAREAAQTVVAPPRGEAPTSVPASMTAPTAVVTPLLAIARNLTQVVSAAKESTVVGGVAPVSSLPRRTSVFEDFVQLLAAPRSPAAQGAAMAPARSALQPGGIGQRAEKMSGDVGVRASGLSIDFVDPERVQWIEEARAVLARTLVDLPLDPTPGNLRAVAERISRQTAVPGQATIQAPSIATPDLAAALPGLVASQSALIEAATSIARQVRDGAEEMRSFVAPGRAQADDAAVPATAASRRAAVAAGGLAGRMERFADSMMAAGLPRSTDEEIVTARLREAWSLISVFPAAARSVVASSSSAPEERAFAGAATKGTERVFSAQRPKAQPAATAVGARGFVRGIEARASVGTKDVAPTPMSYVAPALVSAQDRVTLPNGRSPRGSYTWSRAAEFSASFGTWQEPASIVAANEGVSAAENGQSPWAGMTPSTLPMVRGAFGESEPGSSNHSSGGGQRAGRRQSQLALLRGGLADGRGATSTGRRATAAAQAEANFPAEVSPLLRLLVSGNGPSRSSSSESTRSYGAPPLPIVQAPSVPARSSGDSSARIVEALRAHHRAPAGDGRITVSDMTLVAAASSTRQVAAAPSSPSGGAAKAAPAASQAAGGKSAGAPKSAEAEHREVDEIARQVLDEIRLLVEISRERSGKPWA